MIKRLILIVALILIIFGLLFVTYRDYKIDVELCCENYRTYQLAQFGGECNGWNFAEHLLGIRKCSVENTGESLE